jgi:hypothetical protein
MRRCICGCRRRRVRKRVEGFIKRKFKTLHFPSNYAACIQTFWSIVKDCWWFMLQRTVSMNSRAENRTAVNDNQSECTICWPSIDRTGNNKITISAKCSDRSPRAHLTDTFQLREYSPLLVLVLIMPHWWFNWCGMIATWLCQARDSNCARLSALRFFHSSSIVSNFCAIS